ncbi:MAG TPA: T9SS type A sorting domain-containing protein [Flavobacterium sp.]|nr:T9SS type A sorting domain-containing protein [Flavobacterium sp.]
MQIGVDIDGEAPNDQFGSGVAISSNGSVIAVGAVFNDGNGVDSGRVQVFKNILGVWTQIGSNIDGDAAGDQCGTVALSSDGTIIAVGSLGSDNGSDVEAGHVRVFENTSGVWTQIGSKIVGEGYGDNSGVGLALSWDGTIVAIGAPHNNNGGGVAAGHVRVFENISGVWTQIGNDIDGKSTAEYSGHSLSLSSDGSIVAIGARGNDPGHVRIYQNISGIWTQIGNEIQGEAVGDESGVAVSLSSNGNIVAIGARGNNGNGLLSGHVRIYQNISGIWTQIGNDIDGEAEGDWSGSKVSLSSDGTTVAIGSPWNNDNGKVAGHVRIFKNMSGVWRQVGNSIDGKAAGDWAANAVLSSDGNTVIIGATLNSDNGQYSGKVRVYDISNLSSNTFVLENFNIYPNPTSDVLNISLENNLTLEKITIYNNSGQIVKTAQQNTVDVSNLSSGIYFVEVITNQGIATKKVVVK